MTGTSGTLDWFTNQEFRWRLTGALFWSCFLGCFWSLVISTAVLYLQTPHQPLSAIIVTIRNLMNLGSIFYLALVAALIFLMASYLTKYVSVIPTVRKSVVSCMGEAVQSYLLSFLHFVGLSFFLTWCVLHLSNTPFTDLLAPCSPNSSKSCYNHQHIFLLLSGAYAGLLEAVEFHFNNGNYMSLPIINLDNYTQVKLKIQPRLWSLLLASVNSLKYFYPCYLLFSVLSGSIYNPAGLSYAELMSPVLALSSILVVFFMKVVCLSIVSCISVHSTAPLSLELANLLEGVASEDNLLATLCLQNLSDEVADKVNVRREIFALSLPGGHPHSWNKILDVCNKNHVELSNEISKLISPPPPESPVDQPAAGQAASAILSPNMRRLAPLSPIKQDEKQEVKTVSLIEKLNIWCEGVLESLKKRPLLGWLVKEPQDLAYRLIFAKSQAAIFSVEILSHIVSASIKEDSYGVVQKDLPNILTDLLSLEQNIDRCRGLGVVYRKKTGDLPDVHLKQELKCAVKSALFRIVLSFKDHILAVPLSPEFSIKIENYNNFLEA